MAGMLFLTAGTLRAILCYIDPKNTPKIAYDKDMYAQPLIDKIKEAVGDDDGSQPTYLSFNDSEKELERQFYGVCKNIQGIFEGITFCGKDIIKE